MLNEEFEVQRHGSAGVAFLGVELADAWIVILGVFAGLFVGFILQGGALACIAIWVGGFLLNKWYADWRTKTAPGQVRTYFFRTGLIGYSNTFKGANVLFQGDEKVINPDAHLIVDEVLRRPRLAAEKARKEAAELPRPDRPPVVSASTTTTSTTTSTPMPTPAPAPAEPLHELQA